MKTQQQITKQISEHKYVPRASMGDKPKPRCNCDDNTCPVHGGISPEMWQEAEGMPEPAQAHNPASTGEHSPLPWATKRVSQRYGCYGHEITPPYRAAMTMRSAPIAFITSDDNEDRANAAFIVRACNNVQRLSDELEHCRDLLIAYRLAFTSSFSPDADEAIKSSYQALQDAGVPNAQKFNTKTLKAGE